MVLVTTVFTHTHSLTHTHTHPFACLWGSGTSERTSTALSEMKAHPSKPPNYETIFCDLLNFENAETALLFGGRLVGLRRLF